MIKAKRVLALLLCALMLGLAMPTLASMDADISPTPLDQQGGSDTDAPAIDLPEQAADAPLAPDEELPVQPEEPEEPDDWELAPTPDDEPQQAEQPEEGAELPEEEEPPVEEEQLPQLEDVTLGDYQTPTACVGGLMTLAFPVRFTLDGQTYETNGEMEGGEAQEALQALSIAIAPRQAEDFPLDASVLRETRPLLDEGESSDYAVFEDIAVDAQAEPGSYSLALILSWRDAQGQEYTKAVSAQMELMTATVTYGGGIIVFTYEELKDAIENTSYNPIYLGYCDAASPEAGETYNNGEITIGADGAKVSRNLSIIGTDPRNGRRMLLIDYASSAAGNTIRAVVPNITVQLQSVTVQGRNYFGILHNATNNGVQIVLDSVTYNGRQAVCSYGQNTSVVFRNCNVTVTEQEVAEAASYLFEGNNTFEKTTTALSTFWLNNTPRSFVVAAGASVKVKTQGYLLYNDGINASTSVTINGSMDVTTSGGEGCMSYVSQYANQFTVNGSLRVTHKSTAQASLRASTLEVNGSLSIVRESSSTNPCIYLSSGSAKFASPGRVDLINPGRELIQGSGPLSISTQAINLWTQAGGGANRRLWNNNALQNFSVSATVSSSATTVGSVSGLEGGNLGVALQASALTTTNFNLATGAYRLLLGRYVAAIDKGTVHYLSAKVEGSAPQGSSQTLEEYDYSSGALGEWLQSVAAQGTGGRFESGDDFSPIRLLKSRVYLKSVLDELEAHIYADCVPVLLLYYVPPTLDFGTVAWSGSARWVGRAQATMTVRVLDTREGGSWRLSASATPLRGQGGGEELAEALQVVDDGGTARPLTSGAVWIAERPPQASPGLIDLNWGANEGVLLRLLPYQGTPGERYAATITWTLEDAA